MRKPWKQLASRQINAQTSLWRILPWVSFRMGETAQDNEQPEAATQYYMRAFEIDPHHVKALDGIDPHCVEAFHKLASRRTN